MAIHVVDRQNRHLYQAHLEADFKLRHQIYVDERQWMDLERPDKREVDQFDNDDAIYLLALHDDQLCGGTRLVPSVYPHLLSDVFPELADVRGVPRAHDVVEWTRIHVDRKMRGDGAHINITDELMAGVLEYCLQEGFHSITAICETFWLPRWLELGWMARPLGGIQTIEGMDCVAVQLDASRDTLNVLRGKRGIPAEVLVRKESKPGVVANIIERRFAG